MKMLWIKIWISLATVLIAVVTLTLIAVLHLVKAARWIVVAVTIRNRSKAAA